jgi:hypothetical protein
MWGLKELGELRRWVCQATLSEGIRTEQVAELVVDERLWYSDEETKQSRERKAQGGTEGYLQECRYASFYARSSVAALLWHIRPNLHVAR